MDIASVRDYFTGLQDRIVGELEAIEGAAFLRDAWERPQGGGGISRLIEDGKVFEQSPKAGAGLAPGAQITLGVYRWQYPMPNFIGMTDREAFNVLHQVNHNRPGFVRMSATQTRDTAVPGEQDRIHEQTPKPGSIVTPGTTVMLYTYAYKAPASGQRPIIRYPGRPGQ